MSAKWIPGDDELDAMARGLAGATAGAARAEQNRTAVLAGAASREQLPRRRAAAPWWIGAGLAVAVAAAAALALWLGGRGGESAQEASVRVEPLGDARWILEEPRTVRVDGGKVTVAVAEAVRIARVRTVDAVIVTGAARFDVAADDAGIKAVDVKAGSLTLSVVGQQMVVLSAGQSWAVKTAAKVERDTVTEAPAPAPVPVDGKRAAVDRKRAAVDGKRAAGGGKRAAVAVAVAAVPDPKVEPAEVPGAAEFRAGWAALRAGDAGGAATSFAVACDKAQYAALGEDACFWVGAAAKRAGDAHTARPALEKFLATFPHSARANEAAALLGWILYDANDLAGAEKMFHQAEHDRVPQVRDSATRGLTAISRRR